MCKFLHGVYPDGIMGTEKIQFDIDQASAVSLHYSTSPEELENKLLAVVAYGQWDRVWRKWGVGFAFCNLLIT